MHGLGIAMHTLLYRRISIVVDYAASLAFHIYLFEYLLTAFKLNFTKF
jgi:hypothetical protein